MPENIERCTLDLRYRDYRLRDDDREARLPVAVRNSVLPRCWIFGFVLLFIWLGAFLSGAVYRLHGPLMGLSEHDLNVIHYCGMAFLKLCVIVFFFFPWLAIKMVLRKAKG